MRVSTSTVFIHLTYLGVSRPESKRFPSEASDDAKLRKASYPREINIFNTLYVRCKE
jgi:hypothetical protein